MSIGIWLDNFCGNEIRIICVLSAKEKAPVQWASEGMQEQYVEVYGTKNIYIGTGAEVIFIGKLDFRKLSGAFIQRL